MWINWGMAVDKQRKKVPPKGKPFVKGDPRIKAGPGRPRDEWKAWLRSVVDSGGTREAIEAILRDPSHPAFGRVLAWADERGWGTEVTPVEADATLRVVVQREGQGG